MTGKCQDSRLYANKKDVPRCVHKDVHKAVPKDKKSIIFIEKDMEPMKEQLHKRYVDRKGLHSNAEEKKIKKK